MNPAPNQPSATAPADTEPTVELRSPPVWPFVLLGILFYGSQLYLDKFSGGFRGDVYAETLKQPPPLADEPPEVLAARKGREVFNNICAACHQQSGLGVAGQFPPLVGSEWVSAPKPDRMIRIVLDGLGGPIKVKDQDWNNLMAPVFREPPSDELAAAVITFVRGNQDWSHNFSPVTAAQVKAIREATSGHAGSAWTNDELQKVPDGR